jgi:hypothetical protein
MKLRNLWMPSLAILAVSLCGCGSVPVQAVAPGPTDAQASTAPMGGQYVLYRATGLDHAPSPSVERVWVVTASRGERMGFRWVADKSHLYDAFGAYHLEAFIGRQVRDLGTFNDHDSKYIWAGSDTDMNGYFRHAAEQKGFQAWTLQ